MALVLAIVLVVLLILAAWRWSKRIDRRTKATTGVEAMIGKTAEVVDPCRPLGSVHIGGELWEARCPDGADRGDTVYVRNVDGLTLVVDRHQEPRAV